MRTYSVSFLCIHLYIGQFIYPRRASFVLMFVFMYVRTRCADSFSCLYHYIFFFIYLVVRDELM